MMKRFKMHLSESGMGYKEEHPEGEWVKYADVIKAIKDLLERSFKEDD